MPGCCFAVGARFGADCFRSSGVNRRDRGLFFFRSLLLFDPVLHLRRCFSQLREKTARSNAVVLEMIGDLPDADMKPPENVLFVCKLNPVTTDDDLEIIFTR